MLLRDLVIMYYIYVCLSPEQEKENALKNDVEIELRWPTKNVRLRQGSISVDFEKREPLFCLDFYFMFFMRAQLFKIKLLTHQSNPHFCLCILTLSWGFSMLDLGDTNMVRVSQLRMAFWSQGLRLFVSKPRVSSSETSWDDSAHCVWDTRWLAFSLETTTAISSSTIFSRYLQISPCQCGVLSFSLHSPCGVLGKDQILSPLPARISQITKRLDSSALCPTIFLL